MPNTKAYVLRTCDEDRTSRNGFTWPASGLVKAPDWNPAPICGGGLHGFLNGCGDYALADWTESAKWLVVEVDKETLVDLKGKVKFPRGRVKFCGNREGAIAALEALAPETKHMPVMGATRSGGDHQIVCTGDKGSATAGHGGKATAGACGTATVGYGGTAIAGAYGTATVGASGKATAGNGGTASAGYDGTIQIEWYNPKTTKCRITTGYIGEDGLEPDVPYRCTDDGNFVPALGSFEEPSE